MSPKRIPMLLMLLLLALAIAAPVSAGSVSVTCAALDSLSRVSDFFDRNGDRFNADGYFGLSIADIALKTAPSIADKVADACGDAGLVELGRTRARIERLLRQFRAGPGKPDKNGVTYGRFCRPMESVLGHMLGPRAAQFRWRGQHEAAATGNDTGGSIADSVAWIKSHMEGLFLYAEAAGDACFMGLLREKNGRCRVSPTCKRLFLNSTSTKGYTMAHQLMYWIAGYDKSCHFKLADGRPVDLSLMDDTCRRIYPEYRRLVVASQVLRGTIDLAMEEAVFCSILGHRDFITDSTTLAVLRAQNRRLGCLEDDRGDTAGASTDWKLMHDVHVVLNRVCSSHTSGLAAAYLSMSLRT